MPDQWKAVVDTATGKVLSEGTVVGVQLPVGLEIVAVDGPGNGRPWDNINKRWGAAPPPVLSRVERAQAAWDADAANAPKWAQAIAIALGLEA